MSGNIVQQDTNFILVVKKEGKDSQHGLIKRALLTRKASYSISFLKTRRGEGKGRVICAYDFLFRPVFKNISIRIFKLGFKRGVAIFFPHNFL